ncbi:2-hydroxyacid dehydrogenase [Paracoccus sediminicola]|uniref:2-hydroxyacid dehydrogenase n=1 Tax=Paracoccus sediminicola TaxID=3017783 RepID=UPI0022F0C2BA|nr:2-hydroxyacid dehydrogenase [Paracoccus sediminicola]WBU56171.1 2-hydroxyacid dehydrogenase [Paracoccus sediminicola]
MSKPDLLMIGPQNDDVTSALEERFKIHRYWEAEDKQALLKDLSDKVRHIATGGSHGASREIIEALPKLELISSFGVGYDAVDVTAAREAGVRVTNTPDVLNDCVAEVTLGLMISLAHRIPQADRYLRDGKWESEGSYPLTDELTGKRAGILGLGRIGKEIARRLQAFKMEVVYHGRNRQPYEPYPYYDDLETMAREVDWLIVIAPGSRSTDGIVSRQVIEALGPESYLVNIARGSLVDEDALVEALVSRKIKGAALDVFAAEPKVPARLIPLDNVVMLPHTGSATHKTRKMMGDLVVKNLLAHLDGNPLISPVV